MIIARGAIGNALALSVSGHSYLLFNHKEPISSKVLSFVSGTISHTNREQAKQIPKNIRNVPPGFPNSFLTASMTQGNRFTVA
jgi:hypothetical protein